MTNPDKPPLPKVKFQDWPRIPVDTAEGSVHYRLTTVARRPAHEWVMGPDGPYHHPEQSMTQTVRGLVGEALLHLMELGVIDVDLERLDNPDGLPWARTDVRPTTEENPSA
ncbi:hypothetical protein ACIA7S_28645 [Streptomyces sp. NPDC051643]|uniref:hypothetical protein n=1 Tax=Streptomyces sp. NPDC051643 TaxID=3365665 RepID=UPI00379C2536